MLDLEYEHCAWVDGTDCRIYVRTAALPEIVKYLESGATDGHHRPHTSFYPMDGDVPELASYRVLQQMDERGQLVTVTSTALENPYKDVYDLFSQLQMWQLAPPRSSREDQVERWERLQEVFMGDKRDDQKVQKLPIVWFNSVKPTEPIRWLVHLLISMGEFDCEVGLLGSGDMVQNFTRAGLLRPGTAHRREDVVSLTR